MQLENLDPSAQKSKRTNKKKQQSNGARISGQLVPPPALSPEANPPPSHNSRALSSGGASPKIEPTEDETPDVRTGTEGPGGHVAAGERLARTGERESAVGRSRQPGPSARAAGKG